MNRPWQDRADELEPSEGDYCDFIAWEEWIAEAWGDAAERTKCELGYIDGWIDLYALFCNAYDADDPLIVAEGNAGRT